MPLLLFRRLAELVFLLRLWLVTRWVLPRATPFLFHNPLGGNLVSSSASLHLETAASPCFRLPLSGFRLGVFISLFKFLLASQQKRYSNSSIALINLGVSSIFTSFLTHSFSPASLNSFTTSSITFLATFSL